MPPNATIDWGPGGSFAWVRVLLNVIWFVLGGFWLVIGYGLAALIMILLVVTAPAASQPLKLAAYALRPFGRTVVRTDNGTASTLANVIWVLVCGWWLALSHVLAAALTAATIVGIPLAIAHLKLVPVALLPFGAEIVEVEHARAYRRAAAPAG